MSEAETDPLLKCPDCGADIKILTNKCPSCERSFSTDEILHRAQNVESDPKPLIGCVAFVLMFGALFYWLFVPSAEDKDRKAEMAQIEKRQGKHCVSPLDGSNYYVDLRVAAMLRNPDSYDHMKTNTSPVGSDGNHEFIAVFRAENGFGGMNEGMAIGKFSNKTCEVVDVKLVSN